MIRIPKSIAQEMIDQSVKEAPIESCGYLAGKDGVAKTRIYMHNVDQSPEHFSFDPKEQFQALKQARNEGLSLLAVYHSHPESPARLSQEDIRLANDPTIIYIIVSLVESPPVIKAFKVQKADQDVKIDVVPVEIFQD